MEPRRVVDTERQLIVLVYPLYDPQRVICPYQTICESALLQTRSFISLVQPMTFTQVRIDTIPKLGGRGSNKEATDGNCVI